MFHTGAMRVVFYSTVSHGDCDGLIMTSSRDGDWAVLARDFCCDSFFSVDGGAYNDAEAIASAVLAFKPDVAVAFSGWAGTYDWFPLMDSLVADVLRSRGVRTVCNSLESAAVCFDKYRTYCFLLQNGFATPKTVHVDHALFWCERGHGDVQHNVYKEYVLSQIRGLRFPVIVKDTVGLSSYKMEVLPTYKSVYAYLCSRKNSSDRVVQEFVSGLQVGVEIRGVDGVYTVYPPFLFSVNQYGITSPKQSVKMGPISAERFRLDELNVLLLRLARLLGINGTAQVDLIFNDDGWHVIEVNPRISGMTTLYSAAQDTTVYHMLLNDCRVLQGSVSDGCVTPLLPYMCNFKLPLVDVETLKKLSAFPFVRYVNQIENTAARQEREKGYAEIIFGGTDSVDDLMQNLATLRAQFPLLIDESFYIKAQELADILTAARDE